MRKKSASKSIPKEDSPPSAGTAQEPVDAQFETLQSASAEAAQGGAGKGRRPGRALLWGFLVLVVLALGAAGGVWVMRTGVFGGHKAAPQTAPAVTAMQKRIAALGAKAAHDLQTLTRRVAALEQAKPAAITDAAKQEGLRTRLAAMETALAKMQAEAKGKTGDNGNSMAQFGVDAAALAALGARLDGLEKAMQEPRLADPALVQDVQDAHTQISALADRLTALEQRSTGADRRAALALALLALQGAAQTGQAFVPEWQALADLLPHNDDVQALHKLAQTGVPGRAALARSLSRQAGAISTADSAKQPATKPGKKPGLMGRAAAALGSLVSVRRIDGGDGAGAMVQQAQATLADGDLSAAIAALDALSGAARKRAQAWLLQARSRLALEQKLARLKTLAALGAPEEARP